MHGFENNTLSRGGKTAKNNAETRRRPSTGAGLIGRRLTVARDMRGLF